MARSGAFHPIRSMDLRYAAAPPRGGVRSALVDFLHAAAPLAKLNAFSIVALSMNMSHHACHHALSGAKIIGIAGSQPCMASLAMEDLPCIEPVISATVDGA